MCQHNATIFPDNSPQGQIMRSQTNCKKLESHISDSVSMLNVKSSWQYNQERLVWKDCLGKASSFCGSIAYMLTYLETGQQPPLIYKKINKNHGWLVLYWAWVCPLPDRRHINKWNSISCSPSCLPTWALHLSEKSNLRLHSVFICKYKALESILWCNNNITEMTQSNFNRYKNALHSN